MSECFVQSGPALSCRRMLGQRSACGVAWSPRSSAETSNMLDWDEQGTGDSCRILTDEGPRDDSPLDCRHSLKTQYSTEDGSPN